MGPRGLNSADLPHSRRVEKQIGAIQEKSESKKMEVSLSHPHAVPGFCDICYSQIKLARVGEVGHRFLKLTARWGRSINYRIACSSSSSSSSNNNNHK